MAKERNKPRNAPSSASSTKSTPARSTSAQNTPRSGSRAASRRQVRESERRRQRLITGVIIAAALIVVAVFVIVIVNAPAEAPIPEGSLTRYEGVPQSRTEQGFPRLGDPNAPVQVVEYSSFDCSHCREFHAEAIDPIVDRVKTGRVAFTYVPLYGFGSVANGQGAAAAAVCAAEQGKFWQFHDALFDWQGVYVNQAFTNNRINAAIDAFELDRSAYNACVSSGRANDVLNAARTQQQNLLNFAGTPTISINGVVPLDENQQPLSAAADIIVRIDAEIARLGSVPATAEATSEPAAEQTPEATEAAVEVTAEASEPSVVATDEATPEVTQDS